MYKRINDSSIEIVEEELYRWVRPEAERNKIKNAGGKWTSVGRVKNVVVYEHVDSNDFITGWYKIVTRDKKSDGKCIDWVRYYRRVGERE